MDLFRDCYQFNGENLYYINEEVMKFKLFEFLLSFNLQNLLVFDNKKHKNFNI